MSLMSLTIFIIIVTAITSIMAFDRYDLRAKLIFTPYIIERRKEWFRFISHGFIHADYNHLIFNMITLFFFGRPVEEAFGQLFGAGGRLVFILFYLSAIGVASIVSFRKNRNNPSYSALGASGAVSAILYTAILLDPLNGIYLFFIPIPIPGIIFGVLYLVYSSYMSKRGMDNIGHDAHLYGAIYGFVLPMLLKPELARHFVYQIQNMFN
jgi:membrane associated rhomboid family serine protease